MTIPREDKPQDEIIAEVRANREALAAEYDYDVDRIYEAIKQGEASSGRRFIEAEPKRIKPVAS